MGKSESQHCGHPCRVHSGVHVEETREVEKGPALAAIGGCGCRGGRAMRHER